MKLAITVPDKSLDSTIEPRFGRAYGFIIFDTDNSKYEFITNETNMNAPAGAGIQTAQSLVDLKADVVITGNCGPKAFAVLNTAGIKVITVSSGTVRDNIEKFINGELKPTANPNVQSHWM